MPRNLEIKARVRDIHETEKAARALPATFAGHLDQVDTYFHVRHGRLKLREINHAQAELIYYHRDERSNQRLSDYVKYPCENSASLKHLLEASLGIQCSIEKRRTLYMYNTTRIHIDSVAGLGSFVELETPVDGVEGDGKAVTDLLITKLWVMESDFITCSYLDLMQAIKQETEPI